MPLLEANAPGVIELVLKALGLASFSDLAAPLREPVRSELSDAEQRSLFSRLLFPPPVAAVVNRLVYATVQGVNWVQRLTMTSRLAPPETLAAIMANGVAAGKTQREIANDLMPHVDNYRVSAARIARTEGLRVAHETQFEMHEQMADLIPAYQVRATLDQHSRPEHALRNGTVYHRQPDGSFLSDMPVPGPPGKLLREMPHPPLEGDGTPAFNCRCYLTPVCSAPDYLLRDPAALAQFRTNDDALIPDPATYDQWFQQADERRRRLAVGTRRYSVAVDTLGRPPAYEELIDQDGALLPLATIRSESDVARTERIAKVRALIAQRRELIRQISQQGFLNLPLTQQNVTR